MTVGPVLRDAVELEQHLAAVEAVVRGDGALGKDSVQRARVSARGARRMSHVPPQAGSDARARGRHLRR